MSRVSCFVFVSDFETRISHFEIRSSDFTHASPVPSCAESSGQLPLRPICQWRNPITTSQPQAHAGRRPRAEIQTPRRFDRSPILYSQSVFAAFHIFHDMVKGTAGDGRYEGGAVTRAELNSE